MDEPTTDPLDHYSREAAAALARGEQLTTFEWEALRARAEVELREHDMTETF